MILSIIAAVAKDGAIGRDNSLLWRLSSDLKRFKALTTGHSIVMGRRTWESLPNGALPERRNIVISSSLKEAKGAEVYPCLQSALVAVSQESEVFIIGGGKVYEEAITLVSRLYLTEVDASFADADTYFPEINRDEWREVERSFVPLDEKNEFPSIFRLLERI